MKDYLQQSTAPNGELREKVLSNISSIFCFRHHQKRIALVTSPLVTSRNPRGCPSGLQERMRREGILDVSLELIDGILVFQRRNLATASQSQVDPKF
ncbi:hypothetical protein BHE74_00000902 [Ensete ventricosum]|nr:hypothetical protein BHE74_00000902 [Ensete ventricosum]